MEIRDKILKHYIEADCQSREQLWMRYAFLRDEFDALDLGFMDQTNLQSGLFLNSTLLMHKRQQNSLF